MPTSTAAIHDGDEQRQSAAHLVTSPAGCSGFTLLELSLALLIMVVVLGLVLPRLRDPGRSEMLAQAHHLILTFRLLRSEAVLNGYTYRLNYDLDNQRYWVTVADQSADLQQFAEDMGSLAQPMRLESPVSITDVVLPALGAKVAHGQVYTVFYPDGEVDPTVIHLTSGKEAYTLWVNPMNKRLQETPGYREVDYSSG